MRVRKPARLKRLFSMARRSTRNKVRTHASEIIQKLDFSHDAFAQYFAEVLPGIKEALKAAEKNGLLIASLADGKSDYINKSLPGIMLVIVELRLLVEQFEEGL